MLRCLVDAGCRLWRSSVCPSRSHSIHNVMSQHSISTHNKRAAPTFHTTVLFVPSRVAFSLLHCTAHGHWMKPCSVCLVARARVSTTTPLERYLVMPHCTAAPWLFSCVTCHRSQHCHKVLRLPGLSWSLYVYICMYVCIAVVRTSWRRLQQPCVSARGRHVTHLWHVACDR